MTIEFNCPNCGALIAFDNKHAGRQARCLTCGQKFLIPAQSFDTPEKIAPEAEPEGEPIPGFYRAIFVDGWKVFARRENATTLVFVVAVVAFRFFLARTCCMNVLANFLIWGWLFGIYLNLINRVALEEDDTLLPEIELGTSVTWLWYVVSPFLVFVSTLFLMLIPFFVGLSLAHPAGITWRNFGSSVGLLNVLLQILLFCGLFLFPSAILATAVAKDYYHLKPDSLLAPLRRAFWPYTTCVLLLVGAVFIEMHTKQYTAETPVLWIALHLTLNLLLQAVALFAMRAIGLFYRHYHCYFLW